MNQYEATGSRIRPQITSNMYADNKKWLLELLGYINILMKLTAHRSDGYAKADFVT